MLTEQTHAHSTSSGTSRCTRSTRSTGQALDQDVWWLAQNYGFVEGRANSRTLTEPIILSWGLGSKLDFYEGENRKLVKFCGGDISNHRCWNRVVASDRELLGCYIIHPKVTWLLQLLAEEVRFSVFKSYSTFFIARPPKAR